MVLRVGPLARRADDGVVSKVVELRRHTDAEGDVLSASGVRARRSKSVGASRVTSIC
jgi:hypothetical protein